MRAKAIWPLLVAVAVAALLSPGVASAAAHGPNPRGYHLKAEATESFLAQGTRGYTFGVKVLDHRTLEVTATKLALGTGIGSVGATYTVPYRRPHDSDAINARIGGLGRIDVRFVRESVKKEPPFLSECHGGKTVIEEGDFVGTISFRGERGYTRVRAHHAFGTITKSPALTCRFHQSKTEKAEAKKRVEKEEAEIESGSSEPESEGVELKVTAKGGRAGFRGVRIRLRNGPGDGFGLISFDAEASRRRGRIEEASQAGTVFDAGKSFVSPEPRYPTREAVIRPGRPFIGSATFRRAPEEPVSWTGDLRVELPGFGIVRLAGAATHVAMCEPINCMGR
ncbi:MAG: hypothetical protein QM729_13875 [Solirubrobacterales bacterium]